MNKYCLAFLLMVSFGCVKSTSRRLNIVVIGNSLTRHPPAPGLGWTHNWGMAASTPKKDFCAILGKSHHVQKLQIPYWELTFNESDFLAAPDKKIDVLIIELGENVATENLSKFREALPDLIARYKQSNTKVMLIGNFWKSDDHDAVERKICEDYNYVFVDLSSIHNDKSYSATEYTNSLVSIHPNDKGMKFIARKILESL